MFSFIQISGELKPFVCFSGLFRFSKISNLLSVNVTVVSDSPIAFHLLHLQSRTWIPHTISCSINAVLSGRNTQQATLEEVVIFVTIVLLKADHPESPGSPWNLLPHFFYFHPLLILSPLLLFYCQCGSHVSLCRALKWNYCSLKEVTL